MLKKICGKVYDTDSAELVKKLTSGSFGDAEGYEEALYLTDEGFYFLYTNGGESSKYPKEDIKRMSKVNADKWLEEA